MRWSLILVAASTVAASGPSYAKSGKKDKQSCTIRIVDPGRLTQSANATTLSSTQPGAQSARADVEATKGGYRLYVDAPYGFSVFPSGAMSDAVFRASYSGFGATSFSEKPAGTETKLKKGTSEIRVDFVAEKLRGSFPSGRYETQVTMRCE